MDLKDSFQSAAASMGAVHFGRTVDTLKEAYASAMGPQIKDLCGLSMAEQFDDLTGMRQVREVMRQMDQVRDWIAGDFAGNHGQAVLKEMARQNDLSQIVDRCLSLNQLEDFDTVGRIAAAANAPWFEASDWLRQQAEAWSHIGEWSTDRSIRTAMGADVASQVADILERETRAWDAWADRWRDPFQDVVSRLGSAGIGTIPSDFLIATSHADLSAMFGQAVDARQLISDTIGQLHAMGCGAYERQARKAFNDVLGTSLYQWADGRFDGNRIWHQEYTRPTFEPADFVDGEPLADKRARLGRFLALVWHGLRSKRVSKFVGVVVASALGGTIANVLGTEYNLWRNPPAVQPAPATHAAPPTPALAAPLNVGNAVVVDTRTLPIRQGPNAKERVLASAGYGHVLRVLKSGSNHWAQVEYIDPVHPGVRITGWANTTHTKRVDAETLRLLWCGMIERPTEIDQCRPN